jgi:hypothetical protein
MKKLLFFIIVSAFMICTTPVILPSAFAQEGIAETIPNFTVARLLISANIENIEPVGIANDFLSDTEKVYCFLEARDIVEDTSVRFVWYLDEKQVATVHLPIMQGARWRTYSSKNLAGLTGIWKVELQDADANVLETIKFTVE